VDASEPKNQTGDELLPARMTPPTASHCMWWRTTWHQAQHPAHADARELPRDRGSGEDNRRETLALNPDGVFFSNGPGDPEPLDYAIETVRKLQARSRSSDLPGHQIFGWRWRQDYKLKFGHHGGNHPS